ncbi:MAG: flagellin biosynthesis protein FlgD [Cytophagaceae bacterium SCN 52-12]|nr:MAG: flagellin biosynthesis protein FlgD [Cytophagaceae bacterium SCN 52-12]
MKHSFKFLLPVFLLPLFPTGAFAQSSKYKCMVQMNSYEGLEAYVVISLIDPKGAYEKTLYVLGPDKQWYNTLKDWHKFETKTKAKLSAITGASVPAGDRAVKTIEIEDAKLSKGYKLRFESAVEEQKYHVTDVEIPLTPEALAERAAGSGYIRFVKLSKVQ